MQKLSKDKLGLLYPLGLSLIILSSFAYVNTTLAFAQDMEDNSTIGQDATLAFAQDMEDNST
ncbi:MAG: hypothetical protein ACPKPY_07460, partial [Nitrososphaeraceae archaeon]